ncbi:hypothetical protein [Polaribacter sp. MED152]|uniref:hypothetical protein n=1 Tax=Polaribacter sp. MED152 TaxID=313598 RepID=UPI000068C704|nr:hypothetical protein [Polaribacter sp. MED152]EAQ42516.1 hypothetical protein MED152_07340 [Polaribacter sp. MED152]
MRELNTLERKRRYASIREEVHERVLKSYSITLTPKTTRGVIIEKSFFYDDLINCLGEYEVEFILYNLFYEDRMFEIIQHLNKNNFNRFLNLRKKKDLKFHSIILFFLYLASQKVIKKSFECSLLVNYLHNYIPQHEQTWSQKDFKNNRGIGFLFSKKIIDKLSISPINWEQIIFIYALFFKLWNILPFFKKGELRKKAFILDYFTTNYCSNLDLFISKHSNHKNQIFSNKKISESLFLDLKINLKYYKPVYSGKDSRAKNHITDIILYSSYFELIEFILKLNKNQILKTFKSIKTQTSNITLNSLKKSFNLKSELLKKEQNFWKIKILFNDLIEIRHKHSSIQQNLGNMDNISKIDLFNLCVQEKVKLCNFISTNDILKIKTKASNNKEFEVMKNFIFERFYLFEY